MIDLLCYDRSSRELVGIELKHQAPDRGLPAQMIDYMMELECLAKKEKRRFRGLVITGQPDERLRDDLEALCEKHGYQVDWLIYEAQIELRSPTT